MRRSSRPSRGWWVAAFLVLCLFGGLLGLGLWQLQRAEEKRALLEVWRASRTAEAQPLREVLKGEGHRFQRVRVSGRYDGTHHYLLDSRIKDNRLGYEVLTPLRLSGSGRVILVNRGWVPAGGSRGDLPEIPTPDGRVEVTGHLVGPPQAGIRLGPPDPGKGRWPKVVQYLKPARVSDQLGSPVVGRVIQLDPEADHGFRRDWGAPVSFGPERHVGYAVQWFALAGTLLALFVVLTVRGRASRAGGKSDE